jgi:hypothetical protein
MPATLTPLSASSRPLPEAGTITRRIYDLLQTGMSRGDVARTVGRGYGFVQNVYATHWPERVQSNPNRPTAAPRTQTARSRPAPSTPATPPASAPVAAAPVPLVVQNRPVEPARPIDYRDIQGQFGIELEACGVPTQELAAAISRQGVPCCVEGYNHSTRAHWKIVTDSSVRGNYPFELVSPPLRGADVGQIDIVCAELSRLRARVNQSCGFHVHFDASALSRDFWALVNVVLNYALLESAIDQVMPPTRRGSANFYCKSLRVDDFARRINQLTTFEQLRQFYSNSRYWKVNLQAFSRHQTVEFRQHSGTVEAEKIKNWVYFLDEFLRECFKFRTNKDMTFESYNVHPQLLQYFQQRAAQLAR